MSICGLSERFLGSSALMADCRGGAPASSIAATVSRSTFVYGLKDSRTISVKSASLIEIIHVYNLVQINCLKQMNSCYIFRRGILVFFL